MRDPWQQAELRWHDGDRWTVHLAIRTPTEPTDEDIEERRPVPVTSLRSHTNYRRGRPQWVTFGVPALVVVGVVAVGAAIARSPNEQTEVVLAPPVTLNASPGATPITTASSVVVADPTTTVVVVETTTAPEPATAEPATTDTTAVPEVASAGPVADPALVQACVDFTPIAAFMAMPKYQDLWSQAGLDTEVLRSNCSTMSPDELASIAADMAAVQAFFDSSST